MCLLLLSKLCQPVAPGQLAFSDALCFSSESLVCERTQDEEAILLLSDPLHQFVGSSDRQGLGPQWTEAEVELEAACHLQERKRSTMVFATV